MITPLPEAPSRQDPTNFSDEADAFVAAMQQFGTEVNAMAAAFNVTKWVSGTTYAIGDLVWSPTDFQTYRRKTSGAGSTDPTSDTTNWALASQQMMSWATSVSGTNTITCNAAGISGLVAGQILILKPANSNTGAVTLNVNSLGAKNIFAGGAAVVTSDLLANSPIPLVYDGTQWNVCGGTITSNATQYLSHKLFRNPSNVVQALTDGATVSWDADVGSYATLTLGGDRTLAAPTNLKTGGHYVLMLTSGGHTPTWNAVFKGVAGGGIPAPAASGMTTYVFESDGTNLYLASVPLFTKSYAFLGSDVTLNSTSSYFDGPTVDVGRTGVFFVIGKASFLDATGGTNYFGKLWDGTTLIDSASASLGNTTLYGQMVCAGFIVNPAAALKLSVKPNRTTSTMTYNGSGNGQDSSIAAVRIG